MTDRVAELLGEVLRGRARQPRRKPQRFPHKARLDADERAVADEHGLEVWRDFTPNRGCCPCGYNVYRAGTHPGRPNPSRPAYIELSCWDDGEPWIDVHRDEVLDLLRLAADRALIKTQE